MKLLAVFLSAAVVLAAGQSLDQCLQQDSISCVQKSLFRKAREFFGRDTFELLDGVSLVKAKDGRSARAGKSIVYEQEIEQAGSVAERQSALENFVGEEVGDFFSGRSLKVNFAPVMEKVGQSVRAIKEYVPQDIRQDLDDAVEGRGKKKLLNKFIPLILGALKLKISALAALAYFAIAFMAKKAVFVSLISIAISAFLGIKSLLAGKSAPGHEVTAYNNGWNTGSQYAGNNAGWSAGGASGWDDNAHNQAYSGYHR